MKNWLLAPLLLLPLACGNGSDNGPDPGSILIDAGSDWTPIAGISVPLDGRATANADGFLWEQIAGDTLTISNGDQPLATVLVPDGTAAGASYTFRLTASNAVEGSADTDEMTITVADAVVENFLAAITDPLEIDTTEGIAFDGEGLWVGSVEGFISLFDNTGAYVRSVDVGAFFIGINFTGADTLVVAVAGDEQIDSLNTGTGVRTPITTQDAQGGALGTVNYPLPDRDGNIYFTNRTGGTVFRYDSDSDTTTAFVTGLPNPNALAFGPEDDALYVGMVGEVRRVPINADGSAGTPEVYVGGLGGEVDGLVFDLAGNLWMGPAGRQLQVAPYSATAPATVSRVLLQPGGAQHDRFVNPVFGTPDFGTTTFYWTNLGDRSVGRMDVGVPTLVPPLAPDL